MRACIIRNDVASHGMQGIECQKVLNVKQSLASPLCRSITTKMKLEPMCCFLESIPAHTCPLHDHPPPFLHRFERYGCCEVTSVNILRGACRFSKRIFSEPNVFNKTNRILLRLRSVILNCFGSHTLSSPRRSHRVDTYFLNIDSHITRSCSLCL